MNRISKLISVFITAVLTMAGATVLTAASVSVAPKASANAQGQCSGPRSTVAKTQAQLLANLRAEGVVSQASRVFKSAGYSPVDENVKTWLNTRVVAAKLAKSATVGNFMCKGGRLSPTSKRTLAKGTLVHVALPANLSKADVRTTKPKNTAGWVKKVICVRAVAQTSCSNPITGKVCVVVWVKKKPAITPAPTPTQPAPTCAAGSVLVGGNCVIQTQTAQQTSTVRQACEANQITNGNQCISYVYMTIIQINANCSQVYYGSGGVVVYEQNILCSVVNNPTPTPTPTPVDRSPQITCVYPAHVFKGSNAYLWCEASDPDGDTLSVNIVGDSFASVSGVIPSDVRWDASPCPSSTKCYRATLWGNNVGTSYVVATVTAGGKSAKSEGYVPIKPDEF